MTTLFVLLFCSDLELPRKQTSIRWSDHTPASTSRTCHKSGPEDSNRKAATALAAANSLNNNNVPVSRTSSLKRNGQLPMEAASAVGVVKGCEATPQIDPALLPQLQQQLRYKRQLPAPPKDKKRECYLLISFWVCGLLTRLTLYYRAFLSTVGIGIPQWYCTKDVYVS